LREIRLEFSPLLVAKHAKFKSLRAFQVVGYTSPGVVFLYCIYDNVHEYCLGRKNPVQYPEKGGTGSKLPRHAVLAG
jgi:hypothetical protein